MKAIIWVCAILIFSAAITLLKYAGITLGAFGTILLFFLLVLFPTKKLCNAWANRKASKSAAVSASPAEDASEIVESTETITTSPEQIEIPQNAPPRLDARSATCRNAHAAEKRLNATEAEMRFASDIAAGIYTSDMIPSIMDADKIMELADCYIAEMAFDTNDIPQEAGFNPANSSQEIQDMTDRMRVSSSSGTGSKAPAKRAPIFSKIAISPPFRQFLSWVPVIVIVLLFIALCVYTCDPDILSPENTPAASGPDSSDDAAPSSHAVDYKTRYVGSVNSDFVHITTCRHAENILEENRIYYKNVADAVTDGRSKCSVCLSVSSTSFSTASSGADSFTQQYLELRKQREEIPPSISTLKEELEYFRKKYGLAP